MQHIYDYTSITHYIKLIVLKCKTKHSVHTHLHKIQQVIIVSKLIHITLKRF